MPTLEIKHLHTTYPMWSLQTG